MRKPTKAEVNKILEDHNLWRGDRSKGKKADFSNLNLTGFNFDEISLCSVSFEDSNLTKASFRKTNLYGANLNGARLYEANFEGAELERANLEGANAKKANFKGAILYHANLSDANFNYTNLTGADLRNSHIYATSFFKANLKHARLPSALVFLQASWYSDKLPNSLIQDLMNFDAQNHPNPQAFDGWGAGGPCPMNDVKLDRAIPFFGENRQLWCPNRTVKSPFELLKELIKATCSDSDYHPKKKRKK